MLSGKPRLRFCWVKMSVENNEFYLTKVTCYTDLVLCLEIVDAYGLCMLCLIKHYFIDLFWFSLVPIFGINTN